MPLFRHWGPVIRPQSKVAKFGRLAKIGELTVPSQILTHMTKQKPAINLLTDQL